MQCYYNLSDYRVRFSHRFLMWVHWLPANSLLCVPIIVVLWRVSNLCPRCNEFCGLSSSSQVIFLSKIVACESLVFITFDVRVLALYMFLR